MSGVVETEAFIRFQLDNLSSRNSHHEFEEMCRRIAKARISLNIIPATGPVSAGGDQGKDAESYHTELPQPIRESPALPAPLSPRRLAIACTLQKRDLKQKILGDLKTILSGDPTVTFVAYFISNSLPVAARHQVQADASRRDVDLAVFDGEAIASMLVEPDLLWIAEAYLNLPAHLIPDFTGEGTPDWYVEGLAIVRGTQPLDPTPGTLAFFRGAIRHATSESPGDVPDWITRLIPLVSTWHASGRIELAAKAVYEIAVARLKGLTEGSYALQDLGYLVDVAMGSDNLPLLQDACVLASYTATAWLFSIVKADFLDIKRIVDQLKGRIDREIAQSRSRSARSPNRHAQLLSIGLYISTLPDLSAQSPSPEVIPFPDLSELPASALQADPRWFPNSDVSMRYLVELAEVLPEARAFPIDSICKIFDLLTPALVTHQEYKHVRGVLDEATEATAGDDAVAQRCVSRAQRLASAEQYLEALEELHHSKVRWWHGDTVEDTIRAMRLISLVYEKLHLLGAAKMYALLAIAVAQRRMSHEALLPAVLAEIARFSQSQGMWLEAATALRLAITADKVQRAPIEESSAIVEDALTNCALMFWSTVNFSPMYEGPLRQVLGEQLSAVVTEMCSGVADNPVMAIDAFDEQIRTQMSGWPYADAGPERKIQFSAAGLEFSVKCKNNRSSVLSMERFVGALQVVLADLALLDLMFMPSNIYISVIPGSPIASDSVRFNHRSERSLIRVWIPSDPEGSEIHITAAVTQILFTFSVRSDDDLDSILEQVFERGLPHKLGFGNNMAEILGLFDNQHYEALCALPTSRWVDDPFPVEPHELMKSPSTLAPMYEESVALAAIEERYSRLPPLLTQTLPRVLNEDESRRALDQLREEGWLDWQILLMLANIRVNYRLNPRGTGATLDRDAYLSEFMREETPADPPLPLDLFTVRNLRLQLSGTMLSTADRLGLSLRVNPPNMASLRRLLNERFRYDKDDVDHEDFFTHSDSAGG